MTETVSSEEARLDAMWAQRCATLNRAWVQVRYHRKRQRYFDTLDKFTKAVTVVLGGVLMGRFLQTWLPWLATAITALGLLALVFSYGERKHQHQDLSAQAARLIASIESTPVADLTFMHAAGWNAEYARIVASAPPPLKTLTLICEREQAAADGYPDHVPAQPWYRWIAAYVI